MTNSPLERLRLWGEGLKNRGLSPLAVFVVEGTRPIMPALGAVFSGARFLLSPWFEEESMDAIEFLFTDPDARNAFIAILTRDKE